MNSTNVPNYMETAVAVFLEYLTHNQESRVDFLIQKQKDTGWPPNLFLDYLWKASNLILEPVEKQFADLQVRNWEAGIEAPKDCGMPLSSLTDFKVKGGQIMYSQLAGIREGISQYQKTQTKGNETARDLFLECITLRPEKRQVFLRERQKALQWNTDQFVNAIRKAARDILEPIEHEYTKIISHTPTSKQDVVKSITMAGETIGITIEQQAETPAVSFNLGSFSKSKFNGISICSSELPALMEIPEAFHQAFADYDVKREKQGNIEFVQAYKREVTDERKKELKEALKRLPNDSERLDYLEHQLHEYLQNVPADLLDVSGRTSYPNFPAGTPLFFDRIIQLEIDETKKRLAKDQQGETKGSDRKPTTPTAKHQPSEKVREAIYLYYTRKILKRSDPLYKYWNKWSNDGYRISSNGSVKTYNTKRGHLLAVKMRVQAERKKNNKTVADRIQKDILALDNNFTK